MPNSLQHRTLQLYGELLAHKGEFPLRSTLVLAAGEGCSATGLPAAASIAGATSLTIDPDPKSARATLREGGIDFLVNTLGEALRVLKNEIRQGRPLGVTLHTDPTQALAEIRERGVLADLAFNTPDAPARHHLTLTETPSPALTAFLNHHNWTEQALTGPPPDFVPPDPRRAWLQGITRYQRSATREPRLLWL